MILLYTLGLILYAVFEGATEGLQWHSEPDSKKYHFVRLLELIGIVTMLVAVHLMGFSSVWLIARIGIGSILLGFLAFRLGFIIASGQDEISPGWKYDIWLPVIGTLYIPYPPEWAVIVMAAIGLLLIAI